MVSRAKHDLVTKKQLFATECLMTISITARPDVQTHVFLCVFSLVFDFPSAVNHMPSICSVQSILLAFCHLNSYRLCLHGGC